jgi:hypothetical protein
MTTKRILVGKLGQSVVIGGGGPLVVGLVMIVLGWAKWSGTWRAWRTNPSKAWAKVRMMIGWSPLPQILIGLGLCLAGGSLFAMFAFPPAPLFGTTLGSLLIVAGVVFYVYRPPWIYPSWMRETRSTDESR